MNSGSPSRLVGAVYLMAGLLLFCIIPVTTVSAGTDVQLLQSRMAQLHDQGSLKLQGVVISSRQFLPAFYKQREYRLAWSAQMDNARALSKRILASDQEGLVPADYYADEIQRILAEAATTRLSDTQRVDLDIILSAALARYAYHLRFGKVNPESLDSNWNIQRSFKGQEPLAEIQQLIDSSAFDARLDERISQLPIYHQLRDALAKYVEIRTAGGWLTIPAGPTLKPAMQDERVPLIRQRLQVTEDLSAATVVNEPLVYDAALQDAVEHFQLRHGLDIDGIIGKGTLAAMNIPVAARIDQIRANLERARWVSQDIPKTYVIVDIAGFTARLYRDGEVIWDEPAQVGQPYRSTPVFRDDMTYLELNPTWTIPPTILAKDILPKIKNDISYLQKMKMQVLTHKGEVVDPNSIDWSSISARGFPYIIRQTPGPHNALGRVKFMFPNKHFVYLHDTPSKSLFNRSSRALSSGCIRVRNPYRFAELLLQDEDKWSREKIDAAIDSLKQQRVRLPEPVPVLLLYWTVNIGDDGTVYFKDDIYQRDAKVLAGLDGEYRFDAPVDAPGWLRD